MTYLKLNWNLPGANELNMRPITPDRPHTHTGNSPSPPTPDWPHNEFPDCFVGEGVCSPYTCAHGVCQDVNGTMTCVCQAGYSGPSCEDRKLCLP